MVTWTDNDPRETYIANSGIRAVNAARKHSNTYGNPIGLSVNLQVFI